MAVFSAWAELQIASAEQRYLVNVLKPHIARLTPLWLASLREYSRLRFEPDVSTTGSGPATLSGNLDSIYAALNRETLLQVSMIKFRGDGISLTVRSSTKPHGCTSSTLSPVSLMKIANSSLMPWTARSMKTPHQTARTSNQATLTTATNPSLSSLFSLVWLLKLLSDVPATRKAIRRRSWKSSRHLKRSSDHQFLGRRFTRRLYLLRRRIC